MAPENRPPTPIPASALPMINATLDGAVAHTRDLLTLVDVLRPQDSLDVLP